MLLSNHRTSDADRRFLPADTGAAVAAADLSRLAASDVNSPSIAPSRRLRRLESLPSDVTAYDVSDRPGHVVLSSTRLVEKMSATLNALTVDCRLPGARYRGNGVPITLGRHSYSSSVSIGDIDVTRNRTPATSNGATSEISRVKDHPTPTDIADNVTVTNRTELKHLSTEIESETPFESLAPLCDPPVAESVLDSTHTTQRTQQQEDNRFGDEDGTSMTMDVIVDKGPLGLGFCIAGGLDAPEGRAPITVKRIFKGTSDFNSMTPLTYQQSDSVGGRLASARMGRGHSPHAALRRTTFRTQNSTQNFTRQYTY